MASEAYIPILSAAQRSGVDVAQIRRWGDVSGLDIQRRGLHEFVRLDRVMALSASVRRNDPNSRRGALRARLADAADQAKATADLQQRARDRDATT